MNRDVYHLGYRRVEGWVWSGCPRNGRHPNSLRDTSQFVQMLKTLLEFAPVTQHQQQVEEGEAPTDSNNHQKITPSETVTLPHSVGEGSQRLAIHRQGPPRDLTYNPGVLWAGARKPVEWNPLTVLSGTSCSCPQEVPPVLPQDFALARHINTAVLRRSAGYCMSIQTEIVLESPPGTSKMWNIRRGGPPLSRHLCVSWLPGCLDIGTPCILQYVKKRA